MYVGRTLSQGQGEHLAAMKCRIVWRYEDTHGDMKVRIEDLNLPGKAYAHA